ncbi:hypothetical protein Bpfe_019238, partial [Biomphalaria pfeifferi]
CQSVNGLFCKQIIKADESLNIHVFLVESHWLVFPGLFYRLTDDLYVEARNYCICDISRSKSYGDISSNSITL